MGGDADVICITSDDDDVPSSYAPKAAAGKRKAIAEVISLDSDDDTYIAPSKAARLSTTTGRALRTPTKAYTGKPICLDLVSGDSGSTAGSKRARSSFTTPNRTTTAVPSGRALRSATKTSNAATKHSPGQQMKCQLCKAFVDSNLTIVMQCCQVIACVPCLDKDIHPYYTRVQSGRMINRAILNGVNCSKCDTQMGWRELSASLKESGKINRLRNHILRALKSMESSHVKCRKCGSAQVKPLCANLRDVYAPNKICRKCGNAVCIACGRVNTKIKVTKPSATGIPNKGTSDPAIPNKCTSTTNTVEAYATESDLTMGPTPLTPPTSAPAKSISAAPEIEANSTRSQAELELGLGSVSGLGLETEPGGYTKEDLVSTPHCLVANVFVFRTALRALNEEEITFVSTTKHTTPATALPRVMNAFPGNFPPSVYQDMLLMGLNPAQLMQGVINRGTRRGNSPAAGTGYGGDQFSARDLSVGMKRAKNIEGQADKDLADKLTWLSKCFEEYVGREATSTPSHMAILPIVYEEMQGVRSVLAGLLRNNSLMDIAARSEVYIAALDLLTSLAQSSTCNIVLLIDEHSHVVAKSPTALKYYLGDLKLQAKTLRESTKLMGNTHSNEFTKVLQIADKIDLVYEETRHLDEAVESGDIVPLLSQRNSGKEAADSSAAGAHQTNYCEIMKGLQFESMHLFDNKKAPYTYNREAKQVKAATTTGKTTGGLRITKEISSLCTTLPLSEDSTVFVRVDNHNMSCLKALISGPTGTPYAFGLFEFDILLPSAYPNTPPHVTFCTTGGGRVRFNPNLYENGKVCLSLLGTWAGPGWNPLSSTLLQVLVSIQALILNAEPYTNEPAFQHSAGSVASKKYSEKVRADTVELAMVNQLKSPPVGFEGVVRHHFAMQEQKVLEQVEDWSDECTTPAMRVRLKKWQRILRPLLTTNATRI